jgi:predicted Zn-dependent protease
MDEMASMPSLPLERKALRRRPGLSRGISIAAALALAAVGWLNRESIVLRYRLEKQQRALRQAKEFFERHDSANAELAIDVALDAAPDRKQGLRAIARAFPHQAWPCSWLLGTDRVRDDAADMREILGALRDSDPAAPLYRYDWALLSLLTQPTGDWDDAKRELDRLYRQDEANPFYATGYAFALAQAGHSSDALTVVETLSPADRDYPPRLPYLAYVYGLNGRGAEVERMRALAQGTAYLREERELLFSPSRVPGSAP